MRKLFTKRSLPLLHLLVCLLLTVAAWPQSLSTAATIAPSLSWTTGTQKQMILGGSALLSVVHAESYCDPHALQFGIAADASNTSTQKLGGTPVLLDNNDLNANVMRGVFGARKKADGAESTDTHHYLGVDSDLFINNSLGIGLQQIYAAEYQYYFAKCNEGDAVNRKKRTAVDPKKLTNERLFASAGFGAGFMDQRLYSTPNTVQEAVLPISAQVSYLMGKETGKPPKLIWYGIVKFLPVPANMHAYQLSILGSLQIPTPYRWLTLSLNENDLYMNNAPTGHKRNYQNGTVSFVFSYPRKQPKQSGSKPSPDPNAPVSVTGACFGGDKLARLYCYDDVTIDECSAPNMFRSDMRCSGPVFVQQQPTPSHTASLKDNLVSPTHEW